MEYMKNFFFLENIVKKLSNDFFKKIILFKSNIILYIRLKNIYFFLYFLKNHSRYKYNILMDLTCVDYPNNFFRFNLIYNLLSIRYNTRIIVIVELNDSNIVPSINNLFKSSNWLEREVWDMFGIFFYNNLDLRRILTDYGFKGFPLRKDFPLTGFLELRYDDEKKKIINESLEITQEFRSYNFISPWEQLFNLKII